jgi:hypothetical protein
MLDAGKAIIRFPRINTGQTIYDSGTWLSYDGSLKHHFILPGSLHLKKIPPIPVTFFPDIDNPPFNNYLNFYNEEGMIFMPSFYPILGKNMDAFCIPLLNGRNILL